METVRARNGIVFDILKKYFNEDIRYLTKEDYVVHFKILFREHPEEMFILVSIDDNKVIGYIIAALHETGNYVWLYMLYADDTMPISETLKSLERLENWTENAMGVYEIRGETFHDRIKVFKRYGYEYFSTIVSKMLKDEDNG